MKNEATPRPWRLVRSSKGLRVLSAQDSVVIPDMPLWREGDLQEIVEAVNAYDTLKAQNEALLHACETVLPFLKDTVNRPRGSASMQRIGADAEDSLRVVDAALARVRP